MLIDAELASNARNVLWSHAMDTATILDNLLPRKDSTTNAYDMWGERAPVDRQDLKEWGRLADVTKRDKIKPKLTPKAVKCIFLGYPVSHSSDALYFYCTTTNRVIISRDIKWLDWHGTSALDGIKHLMENKNTPNDSSTGGTTIELLHDSDEEDDQLGRENATPEPIAQPPSGRNEPPTGREEPPAGRNEERVAGATRK
jgi:hypothetical protein